MEIDGHPFPVNMLEIARKKEEVKAKLKVLTSKWAKESGSFDPKFQVTGDEDERDCQAHIQRE